MSANRDVIVIFQTYDKFGVIRKPDSRRMVCKTYIFNNSNFLSCKNWKQNWNIFNTALTALSKGTIFTRKCWFFAKKYWHQQN